MLPFLSTSDPDNQENPFRVEVSSVGVREQLWLGSQLPVDSGSFEPLTFMTSTLKSKEAYGDLKREDVYRWAYHPDPEVPLWIMEHWEERQKKWRSSRQRLFGQLLQDRILDMLERRGHIWGALLDRYLTGRFFEVANQDQQHADPFPHMIADQLEQVGDWVVQQQEVEPLRKLLEFRYWGLREVVLRRSRRVEVMGREVLEEGHQLAREQRDDWPENRHLLARSLAGNPFAPDKLLREVAQQYLFDDEVLVRVAQHPRARRETRLVAVRGVSEEEDEVAERLLLQKRLRQDPLVCRELARAVSFPTLIDLILEANQPGEQRQLVDIGVGRNASLLIAQLVLAQNDRPQNQLFGSALQPLLAHEDPEIRQTALRLAGRGASSRSRPHEPTQR